MPTTKPAPPTPSTSPHCRCGTPTHTAGHFTPSSQGSYWDGRIRGQVCPPTEFKNSTICLPVPPASNALPQHKAAARLAAFEEKYAPKESLARAGSSTAAFKARAMSFAGSSVSGFTGLFSGGSVSSR